MGRVEGKVALITGAARGQGRAHALRLASEGAKVIAVDLCAKVEGTAYSAATDQDLEETARLIRKDGGSVLAMKCDVRKMADLDEVVRNALQMFGRIDVVVANAGAGMFAPTWEVTEADWQSTIDINLTGAWRTSKACIPTMMKQGEGGSIILTSSGAALRAAGNLAAYAASKSGLMGLCRELALELGPRGIRVNTLHTCTVQTPMMDDDAHGAVFSPGQVFRTSEERREAMIDALRPLQMLPLGWIQPEDVSNAVLFLASDESRMITGTLFRIDAGYGTR